MLATLPFGRTGHDSSRVLFGAAALAEVTQDEADRTLALLLDRGVNHIDIARSYGEAELRLRPFLDRHRDEFFLATKTGDRTAEGAYAEINESLERLRHRPRRPDPAAQPGRRDRVADRVQPGRRAGGAVRALDEGLVRAIGVTGHGVNIPASTAALRVRLRLVLLPYNFTMARNSRYLATSGAHGGVRRPRRGRPDDQGDRARRRGQRDPSPPRGTSRCAPRRHRPRRGLGARPARGVPQHRGRHRPAAARARRGRARHRPAGPTTPWCRSRPTST